EIFLNDHLRLNVGGRVDRFDYLDEFVFSPRVALLIKPQEDHTVRLSYNRAYRAPSVVNNFLDVTIAEPINMGLFSPFLAGVVYPLPIASVGNPDLKEQSMDAFELAYTGTIKGRTTVGIAVYQNDTDNSINFVSLIDNPTFPGFALYSASAPPPGVTGEQLTILNSLLGAVGQPPLVLPRNGGTYLNLGPIRNRGVELSVDHTFTNVLTGSVNYSYQSDPDPQTPDSGQLPYPFTEINLPPQNRFNAALNYSGRRFLGMVSVNYADQAFWTDVLDGTYNGFTDGYTMLNATVGLKWADGRVTTSLKGTNLTNDDIQQHVFGDILKRSVVAEVKFLF
ncbi:MAG TPA: TonB-dependent receptor, partial [Vicinamibacteria bacterium]|nr:TonB-dependent receptor [Vicinamibacteria bacterium]